MARSLPLYVGVGMFIVRYTDSYIYRVSIVVVRGNHVPDLSRDRPSAIDTSILYFIVISRQFVFPWQLLMEQVFIFTLWPWTHDWACVGQPDEYMLNMDQSIKPIASRIPQRRHRLWRHSLVALVFGFFELLDLAFSL